MGKSQIQTITGACLSTTGKVLNSYLNALARLPWKTVSKNVEASHYSILGIVVHILGVYNGWLNYNVYGRSSEIPVQTLDTENYHSIKDVRKFMKNVWAGVDKLMEDLDENLLRKKVKAPWLPGSHFLADVLMQVSLEQAHHIGEVIALMWQLDIKPPEMTWIMTTRVMR
jgi:uncharacterized damage-inducible protein DinB